MLNLALPQSLMDSSSFTTSLLQRVCCITSRNPLPRDIQPATVHRGIVSEHPVRPALLRFHRHCRRKPDFAARMLTCFILSHDARFPTLLI